MEHARTHIHLSQEALLDVERQLLGAADGQHLLRLTEITEQLRQPLHLGFHLILAIERHQPGLAFRESGQ